MRPSMLLCPLVALALAASGSAHAQPHQGDALPGDPTDPYETPKPGEASKAAPGEAAKPAPLTSERPDPGLAPERPTPITPIDMPQMFNADTGYLLPAGVIMAKVGVDTGGGAAGEVRAGLGSLAEFGAGSTDLIGVRPGPGLDLEPVRPYWYAMFKLGLPEDKWLRGQPALSIGFRKSFEHSHHERRTRMAELYVVASKKIGRSAKIHAGGAFWDGSIEREDGTATKMQLNESELAQRVRPFGGIELEPLPDAKILLELIYTPEIRLGDAVTADRIKLRPSLAWGVRYRLASWAELESGVRVPNIKDVNLLDAQIFGQLRMVSRRFSRFLGSLKR